MLPPGILLGTALLKHQEPEGEHPTGSVFSFAFYLRVLFPGRELKLSTGSRLDTLAHLCEFCSP